MAVQINVAANQAALTASIQAGVQAYNQRFAQNNQLNLTVNQRAFSQPLGRMTGDVKDFEAALAASNARVIAFGASTAVLGGVIRSFKELASVTIEVEKNLVDINRVFGLTTAQLQKFSTDLFSVSKQTASSFDDASKAALEFSRQGLKAEDTLQRTKDALTLTRLAGISTANAVDALTSTVNGFAATGVTTTQILNKLVAVEQDYAVGAGDLAEALSRTGQAAQEAGVGLDQLNALVTAAQQSTARGGAVIGNALKTIFTRLQRNDTLDQLEAFNIAVRDVQGNILPAVTILQNFAGAYKNLADAQRAQLSEQVAGVYQVNILKAIVNDLNKSQGVYAGALQRGASATNEAEIATAKLNQTLDALLKQTATSTQQLANNIGKVTFEPLAKYGTEQLKSFVESMNEILEGEGVGSTFANGLLKGIRNVIAGPGAIAAFFTLFKLIQNSFTYLGQALPQIAGITTETQNRKNIEQSILQIMQQQGPVSQALAGTMGNQAAQAQLLLQVARQQTAEYQMQTTLAKQLAVQLAGQGVRVKGSGGLQVTRSGGYIPASTKMAEIVGAKAGGYSPGRVVSSPVGGVMNTAEDVKYIPGFAQPFINPPARSKAGRAHRQNAISRTGVDPYALYAGFIPNFASKRPSQFDVGRDFENTVGLDIGVFPAYNAAIDFNKVINKPVEKNYNPRLYKANSFADAHAGYGHKSSENISKVINHLNENYYSYFPKQGLKTKRLKVDDKSSLISKPDLLGDLFIRPYYTEIVGSGSDEAAKIQTSSISSLNTTAQATLLNGVSDKDKRSILNKKIKMLFAQDRVYGNGFIPNFAPPTSAIRVPWFKKFGNASFDAIQPTLGISKANDTDTFRSSQFRSKAFEKAATDGDPNLFAPLYEDFIFKALQLVSQPKIKDQLIRGYVNQPGTDQKQSAFDAFLGDVGLEFKGFPKENLTGSISKNLNDKYERYAKANPTGAAKIKESVIAFNEVGHENQLPSEFGKNFSELAGRNYSEMAKNNPDLVKGLSAETNMLLNRYVKNPAFLAMSAANGFIPNFASRREMFRDLIKFNLDSAPNNQNILGGKTTLFRGVRNNKNSIFGQSRNYSQTENSRDYFRNTDIDKIANDHISEKKLLPFVSASTDKDIAEYFARGRRDDNLLGSGAVGSKTIKNSRIFSEQSIRKFIDKYGEKALKDLMLELSNWGSLGYGKGMAINFQSFSQKKGFEGTDFAKEISFLSNGFIPNFGNLDVGARSMLVNSGIMPFVVDLQRKTMAASSAGDDMFHSQIVNKKFIDPVTGKPIYPKLYGDDIHSAAWKDVFVRGFVDSGTGKVSFDLTEPQKKDKNFMQKNSALLEIVKKKYAEKFKSAIPMKPKRVSPLAAFRSGGFIPNLANFIDVDTLGKNSVHYSGDLMQLIKDIEASIGRNLSSGELRFLTNPKTNLSKLNDPKVLNRFINSERKGGFAGFANGFVPNFAYKQAVMGLEENMSGNKAIFDTKPFPHIRNSSQPTFSSAISDHGGLSNALSDSMRGQKAAGLMNKGFVPNFAKQSNNGSFDIVRFSNSIATSVDNFGKQLSNKIGSVKDSMLLALDNMNKNFDPQKIERSAESTAKKIISSISGAGNQFAETVSSSGIDAINNVRNKFIRQSNSQPTGNASSQRLTAAQMAASFSNMPTRNVMFEEFTKNLSKASTAISIAGPMLAGFAEQAVFANRKRTEMTSGERAGQSILSTGLSAVSTGAGIGSAFGLPGTIIGGAVGGLVALTSALNATTLSAEELAQLNQEQVQKSQASISAASSYIEAQKSLTQMIASGASSSDIEIATKKLSDNFNEIKDVKLQEIFNSTGGDVIAMTKQLQDYTNQVTKESARQTGLYGANLKPEERASALSLGLGKEGTKDFIEKIKKSLPKQDVAVINAKNAGATKFRFKRGGAANERDYNTLAESIVPTDETNRESKVKSLEDILSKDFDKVLEILQKTDIVSEANKAAVNFKQTATRSFNQIFLDMEQQIAKSAFDMALSFEKDSGSRRIQSAILDFSTNFQDSINSFLSNNLPDARKFDFTAATAGQKAQSQLQKVQQDYDKALAEQANDRSIFLSKNAENLTKEFKSSFLPSQAAAEFYQKNVLPQIQQGNFSDNAESLSKQFKIASSEKAKTKIQETGLQDLDIENTNKSLETLNSAMNFMAESNLANTEGYKKLQEAQKALIDLQNQTALFQNKNEMTKLQGVVDTAMREKEIFDTKQANAKKELEINKQLNEARIAVEKDIAVEKAAVDKANLMRMEKMKDLSANIGNALEISKARSTAAVNSMQRRLEDQRETFGMGRTQISERKFGIQADILKEQRAAEDAAINAEIQQRVLEMAAEQENTAATLKLNDTIMSLIETQLRGALGGSVKIEEINAMRMAGVSPESIDNALGKNTYAQYEAFQRIQESRVASAASNTGYNTSTFESNIQSKGFNEKMTQAEQLTFLEKEETAARTAGNLVLAGTIRRYQDQIRTKKEALQITRDDIDAQVRLNVQIEKVNNTFAGRFKKGWGNLKSEGDDLLLNLGENLPKMFADGLVDGIKAAIRESNNLGEALMGIASKFLDSISTTLMQSAVYGILGSVGVPNLPVGGKQRGGVIRAQSGMYISGVGSGDKYPALLENGEYVLNRNAVMAMGGPASLDKLNFSHAPRFAAGGSFSNKFEDIGSMEANMTSYGLEESKLYNELRDQKRAEVEAARQKKRAQRQQMAGLIGSLAAGAVSLGISAGINKFNQPGGYASTTAGKLESKASLLGNQEAMTIVNGRAVMSSPYQVGGSIGSRLSDTIPAYATGGLIDSPVVKRYAIGGVSSAGFGTAAGNNSTVNNNTSANNSFNFNTTVQRDGKIQMGASSTSYAQQDVELSQNLNSKVYDVVLETIRKEKRFGGSLAGIRN